jgi:hypothetical protein
MATQWEYCDMRWQVTQRYNAARPSVVFYRAPNQPWSPPEASPEQLALRLGLDGWELVSVLSLESTDTMGNSEIRWYFKRAYAGVPAPAAQK